MKPLPLLCLLLALACPAGATAPIFADLSAGEYRGKEYVIDIEYEQIIALPRWKPEGGEPKVSATEAWRRARAGLKAVISDIEKFETDEISLRLVGSDDGKRFIYVIHFIDWNNDSSRTAGGGVTPNQLTVWVSTEGVVFLPRQVQ